MESVKKRSELLILTAEKNLSWDTDLAISKLITNTDIGLREQLAEEIIDKIKDCKSEQEVIEVLEL